MSKSFAEINESYNKSITDEYERIKNQFLPAIREKIADFDTARNQCKANCLKDFCKNSVFSKLTGNAKDPEVCNQLESMMMQRGDYEIATFCKVSNREKTRIACAHANTLHKNIQVLFQLYKANHAEPDNDDVTAEEVKFYTMTTKVKPKGGSKMRKKRTRKTLRKCRK